MDDFLKDLMNNENGESSQGMPETPAEPEIPEAPAEPVAPEIPAEPSVPEVTSEPAAFEKPAEPVIPAPPAEQKVAPPAPPVQQQQPPAYNPYAQQNGTYYTPPVQQYRQVNNPQSGYQPPYQPQQQQFSASQPQRSAQPSPDGTLQPKQPKKKGKGLVVIMIIAILCAAIAIGGLVNSSRTGTTAKEKTTTSQSSSDEKEKSKTDEDAQVEVKSSDEAAKTDSKGNLTVAGVVEKVKDSCVGITVYTKQDEYSYFYNYGNQKSKDGDKVASGEGSGVIMKESNGKTYIMTCAHVVQDASTYTVTLDNDKEYEATLVGLDSQTDIGVLSIDATGLNVAEFGDSKDIEVGEDCIVIGCPGGLTFKNSVTRGIVSALDVPVSSQIGYSHECIQVDAAINPGNSGGALFNMQGQVIGINSSKIASTDYEGMGFAVPSNTAVETANSLLKHGYVAGRARLGITYSTLENFNSAQSILSALAQEGYEDATGTMVVREINSDSDLNGKIQQYDMIVAINGKTLESTDIVTSTLAKSKPGDTVKLTVARVQGNKLKTFEVECKLIESKE